LTPIQIVRLWFSVPASKTIDRYTSRRWTLSVLNASGAGPWLKADRETIGLRQSDEVWLNVEQFRQRLADCQTHGHPPADVCPQCLPPLTEAMELYRGDFLTGFTLRDSPEFDEWQFFQTERLRREWHQEVNFVYNLLDVIGVHGSVE